MSNVPEPKRFQRAILATCCVPWNADGTFNEEAFERILTDIVTNCTPHVYIFGTAGEGYAVSDGQYRKIVERFAGIMHDLDADPMVGVISLSMNTVIERIEYGISCGIRQFQLSLPSWGTCTVEETGRFFHEICKRFDSCKFLHYNTPRAGRVLDSKEYAVLAEAFPNFVATKNSNDSMRVVSELHRNAPALRHFLTEFAFISATLVGYEPGLLISRSSINWSLARRFYDACCSRDLDTIASFIDDFLTMGEGFDLAVKPKSHMDGGYDKLFPLFQFPDIRPDLLPPYGTTDMESFEILRDYLRKHLPHWLSS